MMEHNPKHILVVEDDKDLRETFEDCLNSAGYRVTCAPNGKAAQETLIMSPHFDLIITDIRMPEFNGLQLLDWIKQNVQLPVILVSGYTDIGRNNKESTFKADGILLKPFDEEQLLGMIHSVTHNNLVA